MPGQHISGFSEKVALITDGANGIGRAIALQLAMQGCYVIVGYSRESEGSRLALDELKSLGTLAEAIEADCSNIEGIKKLVNGVENLYGRLDLLVNTLKFQPQSSFFEIEEEAWNTTFDVNLKSAFFAIKESVRLMDSRPKPAIVNICYNYENGNVAYQAAQSAIVGMTKSLASILPIKYRVNCITVNESGAVDIQTRENDAELIRTVQGIADNEVARVAVHLLSSDAKALNGQVLTVGRKTFG